MTTDSDTGLIMADKSSAQPMSPGDRIPIPDPTILTTQQLNREIANQQQYFLREIAALREILEARFVSNSQASELQLVEHGRRLSAVEGVAAHSREEHNLFLSVERFNTVVSEWSSWRQAVDRHIAGTLVSRDDFEAQIKRQEILVTKAEVSLIERVKMAMDAHAALHLAHDEAHGVMHAQTDLALQRAETTTRETALLHAASHDREHIMVKEADVKNEKATSVRFDLLTTSLARLETDRGGFISRTEVTDKMESLGARLDVLDKQSALISDRQSISATNAARIDQLEKTAALLAGRDNGIGLSWGIIVGLIAVTATVVGLLARIV